MQNNGFVYCHIINKAGKYAFSFAFARNRFFGSAECSLCDFETKEKFCCAEKTRVLNSGSAEVCFGENGNVSFKSKTGSASYENDDGNVKFAASFDRCFIHTDFKADFVFEKELSKFVGKNETVKFFAAGGKVDVKGRTYIFSPNTDVAVIKYADALPHKKKTVECFGGGFSGEDFFGLRVCDNGELNFENVLVFGTEKAELSNARLSLAHNGDFGTADIISDGNGVDLHFAYAFNDRIDEHNYHADRLFGFINGKVDDKNGKCITLTDIPVLLEYENK